MKDMLKYTGTLMGCAIGDALGRPVEGFMKEQISKYVGRVDSFIDTPVIEDTDGNRPTSDEYGKIPGDWWSLKKGQYTDDTILTLAIAESIVREKCINLADIAKSQADAYFHYDDKGENRGFGGSTRRALTKIREGVSHENSAGEPGTGNGPIMKTAPFGIYMDLTDDYKGGIEAALKTAEMTHGDENAVWGAALQTHLVYKLIRNEIKGRDEFLDDAYHAFLLDSRGSVLEEKMNWILENPDTSVTEGLEHLGNSCAACESFPFTLFMFQKYWDNSYEGLLETINCGGDCDTTGAMYGALLGARDGFRAFPVDLIKEVEDSQRIFDIGIGLRRLEDELR
jgi:ADP-ribosylglycohydrolase